MTDIIKAKVLVHPDPLAARIKAHGPEYEANIVYDNSDPDKPVPLYLNVAPVIPDSPRMVELLDVDIPDSTMVTGAILWWNDALQLFTIEQYNPGKLAAYPLDGGTF